ncbi:MAG TPA: hypothetical protein VLG25_00675 [Patescibacteria group bacterium]|nr:hypothetical protein [Patescibacteria group bacterium]
MKQKDYALVAVVVVISIVFSAIISKLIFGSAKSRKTKVEVVNKISSQFDLPDKKYFNEASIDPTQIIQIGDNPNPTPFNQKP